MNKEKLKEIVNYVFKELPIEEAKKGTGGYIDVVDTKETLSFRVIHHVLKSDERAVSVFTGVRGFINMYKALQGLMQFTPIRYNGDFLSREETDEFWHQTRRKAFELERDLERNFYVWLEENDKLDFYESALDILIDYSGDQGTRMKADEEIDKLKEEYEQTNENRWF